MHLIGITTVFGDSYDISNKREQVRIVGSVIAHQTYYELIRENIPSISKTLAWVSSTVLTGITMSQFDSSNISTGIGVIASSAAIIIDF